MNFICFSLALFSQYRLCFLPNHKLDLPATSGCQCRGNSLPYAQTIRKVGDDVDIYNKICKKQKADFVTPKNIYIELFNVSLDFIHKNVLMFDLASTFKNH